MWQFWKDFFSLFTTKAHRTLLSLEKIEDKAFKVKQSLEASRAQLKKAQVDNQTEANVFEADIKSKKFEIAENENFLLQAAEKGNEEDVIKFNSEYKLNKKYISLKFILTKYDNLKLKLFILI